MLGFFLNLFKRKKKKMRIQKIERLLRSDGDLDELIRRFREF